MKYNTLLADLQKTEKKLFSTKREKERFLLIKKISDLVYKIRILQHNEAIWHTPIGNYKIK